MHTIINRVDNGIWFMLIASFLFAIMGVLAKILSEEMSSVEVVFFRNVFGVILVGYSILHKPLNQTGGKPFLLIFRGVIGFVALLAFFYNIAHIPLGDAMTFSKTSPIFTAIFAFLLLKETLTFKSWFAIIIGFVGIVFITEPFSTGLSKTDWLGIMSGVFAALAYTSIRELKNYYDTRAIVLSFMFAGTIGPAVLMVIGEYYTLEALDFVIAPFVMPSSSMWIYIVLLGLFSTAAQIFMTKAYSSTKAGIVGAISYSNILFSVILGVILLNDPFPSSLTIIGIVLIVISGIIVAKEKNK